MWKCLGAGCIYDSVGGLALNYQPISLINIDAAFAFLEDKYDGVTAIAKPREALNERINNLKSNQVGLFSTDTVDSQNWNTPKGKKTIKHIQDTQEEIYDETSSKYGLEARIVLTPSNISAIQKYNSDHPLQDIKLNCSAVDVTKTTDAKVKGDKKRLVNCQSTFLRSVLTKSEYSKEHYYNFIHETADSVSGISSYGKKTKTGPAYR
jgi:hypothetical protein